MTHQQAAVLAGLSVSVVAQIERGFITAPRVSTLQALAKALGAALEGFLSGTEDEPLLETPKRRDKK